MFHSRDGFAVIGRATSCDQNILRPDAFASAEAQGVAVSVEAGADLPNVFVDTARMTQVLNNLVGNALTHTAAGEIHLTAHTQGDSVALTVQEVRGDTVTVEVALAQRNTMSRLTIEKGQRIVHQVSGEKAGVAYFVTVHAWP